MRDNEINDQIDQSARRLTAGDPDGDLRARVLARIDARSEGPAKAGHHVLSRYPAVVSGFSRTKWIAVPLALAAALAIAVWSTRSAREVRRVHDVQLVQQGQRVQGVQQVREVPQVAESQRPRHPASRVTRVSTANPVNPVNPVPPVAGADSPFAPAPLDIAPLSIAPALVEAIPPAPSIVVADLKVAPIEVRAIDETVETVAPDVLAQ